MDLKSWVKKNGLTTADFAEKAGWSNMKAWRIIEGITSPKLQDVVKIGYITQCNVTPDDLLASVLMNSPQLHN